MSPRFSANTHQDETSRAEKRSPLLGNSERIRHKFGSYGIEILENSHGLRVSSLYSTHGGVKINRTFAVVAYPDSIEPAFRKEHEAIINGESIGIVFKQNGWMIEKHHQYFGEIDTPAGYFDTSSSHGKTIKNRSAIHVYSLVVNKDGSEFQYASIAETHHPDFLQLENLAAIYGPEFDNHLEKKEKISVFLDVIESRLLALETDPLETTQS